MSVGRGNKLLVAFAQRCCEDLEVLAALHDREPSAETLAELKTGDFPADLEPVLDDERGRSAMDAMRTALTVPVEAPLIDELAADYADIYLTHALSASPYESVWLDEEQLQRQEPMFQVRECYRKHGLGPGNWRDRADDHLVLQLQFIAWLLRSDPDQDAVAEAATFMDEHLLRWLGRFSERVEACASTAYFRSLATLTDAYCEALRELMAELGDVPRPSAEAIEARMQPQAPGVPVAAPFVPGMGPVV